ncbi:MAG TPA: hypothetical protein VK595_02620 [Vicinamibacterales bacterium]|nr:hypothetical protein [Vicinamibacterales bacterium]
MFKSAAVPEDCYTWHEGGRMNFNSSSLRIVATGLAVACLGIPIRVAAQQTPSLAELARQEVERRKAIKAPGKVYTDKGTRAEGTAATAAAAGQSGSQAAPTPVRGEVPAEAAKAEESSDAKGESYWRGRITEARENLRRNEAFVEALQSRINGLTADFSARDDPYQRAKVGEERQKALGEQARVKNEIEDGRKLIATIEEEARQAGALPGWLR